LREPSVVENLLTYADVCRGSAFGSSAYVSIRQHFEGALSCYVCCV
jgi:hypothetical protein